MSHPLEGGRLSQDLELTRWASPHLQNQHSLSSDSLLAAVTVTPGRPGLLSHTWNPGAKTRLPWRGRTCSPGIVDPGEAIGEEEASPHEGPPQQGEDQGPGALLLPTALGVGIRNTWGRREVEV